MSRTVAALPAGARITDYISLGVVSNAFPLEAVRSALTATDLPAHVVVCYVIALALYMQSSYREVLRCLPEGVVWLSDPSAKIRVVGNSGLDGSTLDIADEVANAEIFGRPDHWRSRTGQLVPG